MEDTLAHLKALKSPDQHHVICTMSDRGLRSYRCHKSTLAACERDLENAQADYCGVFIQPNRPNSMKGWTRRAIDVTSLCWLFADIDAGLPNLPIPPTILVETARGWHCYWRIEPTQDLTAWRQAEKGIVQAVGGDPTATAPNQLLRLSGWWHFKREPVQIRLHEARDVTYCLSDFASFLTTDDDWTREAPTYANHRRHMHRSSIWKILQKAISKVHNAEIGHRWATLRGQAYHLGHFVPYGLNLAGAIAALEKPISRWQDCPQEKLILDAKGWLLDGLRDSKYHPPIIVDSQIAAWEREDQRARILDTLAKLELPERITLSEMLEVIPDWRCAWNSPRQAKQGIASALRSRGYELRQVRGKDGRYWEMRR